MSDSGRLHIIVGPLWSLVAVVLAITAAPSSTAAALPCWQPPVVGWVDDPFREPACPWCAGNRGIDFGVVGSRSVRTVEAGIVTFAGSVAGTRYVVVQHVDGWKVTYGQLVAVAVARGNQVTRGAVVGKVRGHFFFGLRIDDVYRDPGPYLGELRGRPRLVPIDGSSARPAPPASWSCVA